MDRAVVPMAIPLGPVFSLPTIEEIARSEPGWLRERRLLAWSRFERTPWPSRTDEAWRRTDLTSLDYARFERLGGAHTSREGALPMGEAPWPDEPYGVPLHDGKFETLSEALWTGGSLVRAARGQRERAVIRHVADLTLLSRTVVVLEEASEAVVFEEQTSREAQGLASGVTDLKLGPGSKLAYVLLSDLGRGFGNFGSLTATLERDSELTLVLVHTGGALSRQSVDIRLVGKGARLVMLGITMVGGDQHFDLEARVAHEVGHAVSEVLVKSACKDRARSVFVGTLRVEKGASGTDAYETNRNLLLSAGARADSIPRLEIETDDVRCGHASSSGPVDEDHLFYLMSRGLERDVATRLVVEGFFEDVLSRVPSDGGEESMRTAARDALLRALARRDDRG